VKERKIIALTGGEAKQLDIVCFERLYRVYWKKLYQFCLLHMRIGFSAEEAVQDIFTSLWKRRGEMTIEPTTIENYLYRAAKLKVFDFHRQQASNLQHIEQYANAQTNYSNETENFIHYQELSDQINVLIHRLPARCKQVYMLNTEEGLSYREIAERLSISVNTVKEHLTKARGFLQQNLQEQYELP